MKKYFYSIVLIIITLLSGFQSPANLKANEIARMKAAKLSEGHLIGDWLETNLVGIRTAIYEKGGNTYIKSIFRDGSSMTDKAQPVGRNRYNFANTSGEYYKILPNKSLGFFNRENRQFATGYPNSGR